jgi:hypothetical protein
MRVLELAQNALPWSRPLSLTPHCTHCDARPPAPSRHHVITSSRHHVITSSRHHVITSSRHHVITSSRHHVITSSRHHVITSSRHHVITSSRHHVITSSRHHVITSSTSRNLLERGMPTSQPTSTAIPGGAGPPRVGGRNPVMGSFNSRRLDSPAPEARFPFCPDDDTDITAESLPSEGVPEVHTAPPPHCLSRCEVPNRDEVLEHGRWGQYSVEMLV